jgi:hypothetical protein
VERKDGEQLVGHMIPAWGDKDDGAMINSEAKTENKAILSHAMTPVSKAMTPVKFSMKKATAYHLHFP